MGFRNGTLIATVFATAEAGRRIVIDGTGALANRIQIWAGDENELLPATIEAGSAGPGAPFPVGSRYVGISSATDDRDPTAQPALVQLAGSWTAILGRVLTTLGASADDIYVSADRTIRLASDLYLSAHSNVIQLFAGPDGVPGSNAGVTIAPGPGYRPQTGPWTEYTPDFTGGGGGSFETAEGRWWRLDRLVTVQVQATCYNYNGGADVSIALPKPSVADFAGVGHVVTPAGITGAHVIKDPLDGARCRIVLSGSPGTVVTGDELASGTDSAIAFTLTYECGDVDDGV